MLIVLVSYTCFPSGRHRSFDKTAVTQPQVTSSTDAFEQQRDAS